MPLAPLTFANWRALRNASDLPIRSHSSAGGTDSHVSQRVAISPLGMPTVSGSSEFLHEWANDQVLFPAAGGFTSEFGFVPTISLSKYGLKMPGTGGLEGGGYSIGTGFHWEEGVFQVIAPLTELYFGNDPGTMPEGRLSLRPHNTLNARFWWSQANAAGTAIEDFEFTDIDVPLTYLGSQIPPKPIYFRIVRNMPIAGSGQIHLRVWKNGGASTQTITLPQPNATATAAGRFGGVPSGRTVGGHLRVFWWRGKFSSTYPGSLSFGNSTYWNTPKVFQTDIYTSDGNAPAGFVDSGQADAYWRSIQFPNVPQLAGGELEFRAAATNSLPSGTGSGLLSGSYTPIASSQQVVELNDIQGRYLVIGLRFVPGTQNDLDFGEAALEGTFGGTSEMGFAVWSDTAQANPGNGSVEISFNGEGISEAVLPYQPHYVTTQNTRFRNARFETDSAYRIRRAMGTRGRKTWSAHWILTQSESDALLDFFDARRGGEGAFTFTPPRSSAITAALQSDTVEAEKLAPDAFDVSADFVEVIP